MRLLPALALLSAALPLQPVRATPDACARADARNAAATLATLGASPPPPEQLDAILSAFCAELASCGGPCTEELGFAGQVDWSSLGAVELAAAAASARGECPAFAEALANGAPASAGERGRRWVRARIATFLGASCALLDAEGKARLACGAKALKLDGAAPCGAPTTCERLLTSEPDLPRGPTGRR